MVILSSALGRLRQQGREFRDILSYIGSLGPMGYTALSQFLSTYPLYPPKRERKMVKKQTNKKKTMLILATRSLSKYLRVVSGCSLWPGCFLIILEGFWECRFEGAYPYSRQSPQSSRAKHMGPILPVIRRRGQTCPGRQSPSPSPGYSPQSLHDCDLYRCAQAHQSAPEKRDSP